MEAAGQSRNLFIEGCTPSGYGFLPCASGLMDGAAPIIIRCTHAANIFIGQILFEKPDIDGFRTQGEAYCCDTEALANARKAELASNLVYGVICIQ